MLSRLAAALIALVLTTAAGAAEPPRVAFVTSLGEFVVELDAEHAPGSTENFLAYVRDGFYDGTVFHRVIDGFMVQGGGFADGMARKTPGAKIRNEADNGLRNLRGTVAMARTNDPHSGTSQFFVNLVDNAFLDHRSPDARGWGYAVFGRVVEGMDVVDQIAKVPTGRSGPYSDVPRTPVVVETARVVEGG